MRWQRIVFSVTVTEGLLTEVFEKRKGCGRKAITPVVARILSGDTVCRKSQAEMLGFFIDMWYNKYGDERC